MVPDPQNLTSQILELEGGTMTFMAPELLTPSSYGLQSAAPTREADVYAFGLVIFQVLALNRNPLLPLLDVSPGPDWRATISGHQSPGTRVRCLMWGSSR